MRYIFFYKYFFYALYSLASQLHLPLQLFVDALQIFLLARHISLHLLYDFPFLKRVKVLLRTGNQHARYLSKCRIEPVLVLFEMILVLPGDDDASDGAAFVVATSISLFLNEEHIVRYPLLVQISYKGCNGLRQTFIPLSLKRKAWHGPVQLFDTTALLEISLGNDPLGGCIGNGEVVASVRK